MNEFSATALRVFEERYLLRDPKSGRCLETVDECLRRVAKQVAEAEKGPSRRKKAREQFYMMMAARKFLPNSPTLTNSGKKKGQLSACFVLPVRDGVENVLQSVQWAAQIHDSGGGTGFSFGGIGLEVDGAGPVEWIGVFDAMTDAVKQAGVRRGANMAILPVDHPKIEEFIRSKVDSHSRLKNFNISVAMTSQSFLKELTSQLQVVDIIGKISKSAWQSGDPGMVFLDRVNLFNPTQVWGEMVATNPCGEQPLLAFESCNLGSINVSEYFSPRTREVLWKNLAEDISWAVRFLDNVIEVNHFPLPQTEKITRANRKIGLGIMGFSDLLLKKRVSYDSDEAVLFGERLMAFVDREAKKASMILAKERGAFRLFQKSMWGKLGYPELRNATVTTVAPTGSISLVAGCSSGIEPIFSAQIRRNILDGAQIDEIHPALRIELGSQLQQAKSNGFSDRILNSILGGAWAPSWSVSVSRHIQMQAAFQRHCDSAVSKTVNLPEAAKEIDVREAFVQAYLAGCKGVTVYRDHSKAEQVLENVNLVCLDC